MQVMVIGISFSYFCCCYRFSCCCCILLLLFQLMLVLLLLSFQLFLELVLWLVIRFWLFFGACFCCYCFSCWWCCCCCCNCQCFICCWCMLSLSQLLWLVLMSRCDESLSTSTASQRCSLIVDEANYHTCMTFMVARPARAKAL